MTNDDVNEAGVPCEGDSSTEPTFSASPDERIGISVDGRCALRAYEAPGSCVQYEEHGTGFVFVDADPADLPPAAWVP